MSEEEFDLRARKAAATFLVAMAIPGAYALLAVLGVLPAAPWSPLGSA